MILLVVERRKKKRDNDDNGKAAGKKRARPRKARPNAEAAGAPDPPPNGPGVQEGPRGPQEIGLASAASPQSTSSTAEDQEQAPRAPLPGEIYRRANEWWWRVKLPGEERAKPRPLHSQEAQRATADRETAAKIAFALWEHAVQEDATRQVKRESTEKIERLKAQFLDRVRHFTELVETANAKIEAEAKARAEAEAKLAQMIQAAEAKSQAAEQKQEAREQLAPPGNMQAPAPPAASLPEPVEPLPAPAVVLGPVLPPAASEPPRKQPPLVQAATPCVVPVVPPATGTCGCCEATGIALTCLTQIDSGQVLCPRCLAALRTDATQTDPDVPN